MNRLKELRRSCNLSLQALSKYVDIRVASLSDIENGKQPLREIHVLKLKSFFDVTSDYLLGYKSTGIGIYFASANDDEDHVYISDAELIRIRQEHVVEEQVLNRGTASNWAIVTPQEEIRMYNGAYVVFRSVDTPKEKAGINTSVRAQINEELDRLGIYELEKVLKFINDYIK